MRSEALSCTARWLVSWAVRLLQEKVDLALHEAVGAEVKRCITLALTQAWAPDDVYPEELSPWMVALLNTLQVCLCLGPR